MSCIKLEVRQMHWWFWNLVIYCNLKLYCTSASNGGHDHGQVTWVCKDCGFHICFRRKSDHCPISSLSLAFSHLDIWIPCSTYAYGPGTARECEVKEEIHSDSRKRTVIFLLLECLQTGPAAFSASYSVSSGVCVKRPWHDGTHLLHPMPRLRMSGAILPFSHITSGGA
jgi:hypothetical protein